MSDNELRLLAEEAAACVASLNPWNGHPFIRAGFLHLLNGSSFRHVTLFFTLVGIGAGTVGENNSWLHRNYPYGNGNDHFVHREPSKVHAIAKGAI